MPGPLFHTPFRPIAGNLLLSLRAHTDGESNRKTGLTHVTLITSDNPAAAAARRARALERQARVGILRNPNNPPRPPQRKARLTGKWPNLQSTRRPQAQPGPCAAPGAPSLTDTELARMMKAALAPPGADIASGAGAAAASPCTSTAAARDPVVIPLPGGDAPDGAPPSSASLPGDRSKPVLLVSGFAVLLALTLLAAAL